MAATEAVLGIALDRQDAFVLGLDGQATDRFAEMARTVMEGLAHGSPLVVLTAAAGRFLIEEELWNERQANATGLSRMNRGISGEGIEGKQENAAALGIDSGVGTGERVSPARLHQWMLLMLPLLPTTLTSTVLKMK
ncbi:hypothetical protein D3C78_1329800 [compost metagenome]